MKPYIRPSLTKKSLNAMEHMAFNFFVTLTLLASPLLFKFWPSFMKYIKESLVWHQEKYKSTDMHPDNISWDIRHKVFILLVKASAISEGSIVKYISDNVLRLVTHHSLHRVKENLIQGYWPPGLAVYLDQKIQISDNEGYHFALHIYIINEQKFWSP